MDSCNFPKNKKYHGEEGVLDFKNCHIIKVKCSVFKRKSHGIKKKPRKTWFILGRKLIDRNYL